MTAGVKMTAEIKKPEVKQPELTKEPEVNEARIRNIDANYSWAIIGMKDCEYTKKAVELLKSRNEKFLYQEINTEWQIKLTVNYGVNRLPAIFRGSTYFGGLPELENYYRASFFSSMETFP